MGGGGHRRQRSSDASLPQLPLSPPLMLRQSTLSEGEGAKAVPPLRALGTQLLGPVPVPAGAAAATGVPALKLGIGRGTGVVPALSLRPSPALPSSIGMPLGLAAVAASKMAWKKPGIPSPPSSGRAWWWAGL